MKIVNVEPILLKIPLAFDGPTPTVHGIPKRDIHTLMVKIDTDEGITGYGEAFANAGWLATYAAIKDVIAPRCTGKDPLQISTVMYDLTRGLYNCGRGGIMVFGLSAVDIALWDIAGKVAGMPLYRMLGGNAQDTLPAYASLLHYGDLAEVSHYIAQALNRGYRRVKLHDHRLDIARGARKVAGPNTPLMMDCLCPWTYEEALAASRQLADLNIFWLEEPLYPPDDHAGLARLRAASSIAISAGENVSNLFEFKRLFEAGALSYAQPSVAKVGGVTELRKVLALGESFGVPVIPHSSYLGPGFFASVHVCAAPGRQTWVERYYCDLAVNPFGDTINPKDGNIVIPQGPGLGFSPDMKLIDKLRVG